VSKLRRNIVIAAMSVAFVGIGTTGVAVASDGGSSSSSSSSDSDQAAQDAACAKAGISPSADNIDYDDATGVCKLDSGNSHEGGE